MKRSHLILWAGLMGTLLAAQQAPPVPPRPVEDPATKIRPTYILGPGDQIMIRAFEVEEISDKPFRIDSEGDVNLPILNKVHAGGLTVEQFEAELTERLKTLVKNPQVTVGVVQLRSEPVFFNGYFKAPGIYTLQGRRTLLEMLTTVGGVQPNSSRRLKVTRHLEMGPIPLPNAVIDQEAKVSSVDISIGSLQQNVNPAEDIVLQPLDTVSVDRAGIVYVSGEVNKVGGVELSDSDSMPVTRVLAMVGGLSKDAASEKARVLRQILNTSHRAEIPVNLKRILEGKEADFPLMPNDVLYIPRGGRKFGSSMGLVAIPVVTGLVTVLATRL